MFKLLYYLYFHLQSHFFLLIFCFIIFIIFNKYFVDKILVIFK